MKVIQEFLKEQMINKLSPVNTNVDVYNNKPPSIPKPPVLNVLKPHPVNTNVDVYNNKPSSPPSQKIFGPSMTTVSKILNNKIIKPHTTSTSKLQNMITQTKMPPPPNKSFEVNLKRDLSNHKNEVDILSKIAKKHGIPEKFFIAWAHNESRLNPNAKSGAGAKGIMQIMPVNYKSKHFDPNDIQQSGEFAATEFKRLLKKWGNPKDALMAYNMGERGLRLAKAGKRPFPTETKNYVNRILMRMNVLRNI